MWYRMPRKRRRTVLKGIGTLGIAGLVAGCGGGGDGGGGDGSDGSDGSDGDGSDGSDGSDGTDGEDVNVGMVYAAGGLGDGSFNDQAKQGILQAEEEFGVSFQESQPESVSDFGPAQQQYAQSGEFDLVCCIGFLQKDPLSSTAADFPEQNFMIVDEVVETDNVASYVFREHEGSFLVGHLAGALTSMEFSAGAGSTASDSTNVGFVGGVESELIKRFEAGFTAGVKNASEDVDVITSYVGDFSDPAGGQEQALSMYNSGADIVYHAAGNTGRGVFQAAQEQGRFAIGVDRDQSVTAPDFADVILASMIKRVDTAVYTSVESVVSGEFQGGTTTALGLEREGVGIGYGEQLGSEIPQDLKDAISSARQGIIDGDISVPTSP